LIGCTTLASSSGRDKTRKRRKTVCRKDGVVRRRDSATKVKHLIQATFVTGEALRPRYMMQETVKEPRATELSNLIIGVTRSRFLNDDEMIRPVALLLHC
jgi:hypothetical protein